VSFVIKIVGLVAGGQTPFDGQFLVDYDPERDGHDPQGSPMVCHLQTTPEASQARHFVTAGEAYECWRMVPYRQPLRPDGLSNRPLTAFTIEVKRDA
jgi:hypothetical protein